MTDLMQYEKGYSPCAIQHKYGLTYVQGYEIAERLRKTQELELELRKENAQLKELLKECKPYFDALVEKRLKLEYIPQVNKLLTKIDEVLR